MDWRYKIKKRFNLLRTNFPINKNRKRNKILKIGNILLRNVILNNKINILNNNIEILNNNNDENIINNDNIEYFFFGKNIFKIFVFVFT